ncbi:MAG: hypothetical protein MZV63_42355 [Marinilabiliales bacterium]|nr:hypothetical protein [Marinilabiliales bacterium]
MSNRISYYAFLFVLLAFFAGSCTGTKAKRSRKPLSEATAAPAPVIGQETMLLLKDLEDNGDYVNSQ